MPYPSPAREAILADYTGGASIDAVCRRHRTDRAHVEEVIRSALTGPAPAAVWGEPYVLASHDDSEPPAGGRRWPYLLAAAAVLAGVGGWLVGVRPYAAATAASKAGAFEAAQQACDPAHRGISIADGGTTMIVDGAGSADTGGLSVDDLECVIELVRMPQAVKAHMMATRALDGRQEDSWTGFTASWSYQADDGIEVIVRAVP